MYQMDLVEYKKDRDTVAAKGLFGRGKPKPESSKYVDLKCPECKKEFEWMVE
jgi:ribosomal protein S27E